MIDTDLVVAELCAVPDGPWRSGASRSAWGALQVIAMDEPLLALQLIERLCGCLSARGLGRLAAGPLRNILRSKDRAVVERLTELERTDAEIRRPIQALHRYEHKVRQLRALLSGNGSLAAYDGPLDIPLPNGFDSDVLASLPCPADHDQQSAIDSSDVFERYDQLACENPAEAWRQAVAMADEAAARGRETAVASTFSTLLNLHEYLVAAELPARVRTSPTFVRILANCQFQISEGLLDTLISSLSSSNARSPG